MMQDVDDASSDGKAANREEDEFLASLSHELRSPLSAVLAWVRILRSDRLGPAQRLRALDGIERSTRLQVGLIGDVIDLSRIKSGKLALDIATVDLGRAAEAAVSAARPAAETKTVELRYTPPPAPIAVRGDIARLQQVVGNLVSNAIEFTSAGGSVTVGVEGMPGEARITVRDTGQEIPPDSLAHVFDAFRRDDTPARRRQKGLGLGLAIARHLVELHGGAIVAESADGQGTTFRITLPLEASASADLAPNPTDAGTASRPEAELTGVRVLIVDDDPSARDFMSMVLTECGATVSVAASAMEALDKLQLGTPDVLISDIAMPDADGYALIRRIRAPDTGDRGLVPAIAVTAYAGAAGRRRALAAGYQIHLAKPFEPEELIGAVSGLARSASPVELAG